MDDETQFYIEAMFSTSMKRKTIIIIIIIIIIILWEISF